MATRDAGRKPTRSIGGTTVKSDKVVVKGKAAPTKTTKTTTKNGKTPVKKPIGKAAPKLVQRKAATSTAKAPVRKPAPRPAKVSRPAAPPRPFLGLEPERLGQMLHDRPGWIDELAGITLVVAGMVSFVAQIGTGNPNDTTFAAQLAGSLRGLVGLGGALAFSVLIMAAGVRIVLLRLGVTIRLSWARVISIEVAFAAFVALLHLFAHDPEPRALARAGGGGGFIGWALSELIRVPFGVAFATLFYAFILIVAVAITIGVQRGHLRSSLLWASSQANTLSGRLTNWLATRSQA